MPPRPGFTDYFVVSAKEIIMQNDHYQSFLRSGNGAIWMDLQTYKAFKVTIEDNSQGTLFAPFDFDFSLERCLLPLNLRQSLAIDRRFLLKMQTPSLSVSLSPGQLHLLLQLFNMNFAYDDKVEKLVNEQALPPVSVYNDPAHLGVFIDFVLETGSFTVELSANRHKFAILELGAVQLKLKRYNDFFMQLEVAGEKLFLALLERSWSVIQQDYICTQAPVLLTTGNSSHSLLFHMSKAWNSSKDMNISLSKPFFLVDFRLFPALAAFAEHAFPQYASSDHDTPFDYLTKLRPNAEDTYWDLPAVWTAPELKLKVRIETAIIGLQMLNLPIGLGVIVGEIEFLLGKTSESDLRKSADKVEGAISRRFAVSDIEIAKFMPHLPDQFSQIPHFSKCSNPISLLVESKQDWESADFVGTHTHIHCEEVNMMVSLQDCWLAYQLIQAQQAQPPLFPLLATKENAKQTRLSSIIDISMGKSAVLVVNQTYSGCFPLIHLLTPNISFTSHQLSTGFDMRLAVYLALKAYNLRQDHWEPVIEPVHCLLSVTKNETGRQQEVVQVSIGEEEGGLELTLSEGVLDSLCRAGMLWNGEKLAKRTEGERLIVKNCTGYRVIVGYGGALIPIETGYNQELEVSSYDEFLALSPNSHTIVVYLEMLNQEKAQLPDISLTKFRTQTLSYHSKKTILTSLTRDSEGRRVLFLRSPLSFLNKTAMDFRLIADDGTVFQFYQNETCGLPLEFGGSLDFVPLQGTRDYSMSVSISDILKGEVDLNTSQFSLHLHKAEERANGLLVHVMAPLLIRNFLPVTVNLSLTSKKQGFVDIILGKGAYHHEHGFSNAKSKTKCAITIAGFTLRKMFSVFSQKERNRNQVVELQGREGVLCVNLELADVGNRRVSLYCQAIILNLTFLPLAFHYKSSIPIAGQTIGSEVILAKACSSILVSLDNSKKVLCKVKTAGLQNAIDLTLDDGMNYSLAYKVEVSWATPEEYIHTKIVTIAPRFILVNGLRRGVSVRQNSTEEHIYPISAGDRSPIYWTNGELPEEVQILLEDSELLLDQAEKWLWSQPFPLTLCGAFTILCENVGGEVEYIRVSSVVDGISSIFTLAEELQDQAAYQVLNESQSLSVVFRQVKEDSYWPILQPGNHSRFAWRHPKNPQLLELQVLYAGIYPDCLVAIYKAELSFSELQGDRLVLLSHSGETGRIAYIRIVRKGVTKTLVLSDCPEDSAPAEASSVLELTLPKLGFSLVANAPSFTTELVYLTLDHLKLSIIRSPLENLYRLQITHIQADNQYLPRSDFPIAFRSVHMDTPSLLASVITTAPGHFDLYCFKSLTLEVNKLICKLESPLLQQVLNLWTRLHVTLKTYRKSKLEELFETGGDTLTVTPGWTQASEVDKMVYMERIFIQKLAVEVHFKHVKDVNSGDEESLAGFLTALGTVPINIDGVPIELEGLYMTDLSGTRGQIQQILQDFYISDAKRSVLKLIGYSDLVGNPLGVLNRFSQADSLSSVFSSTMDLTVGTVSRLSRGLATGLMAVTQGSDAVREHQREKIKFRPKNLLQGMGYGARALIKGVGEGVAGLVVKPIRGAQRSGLGGLLKGSYQGVSGLLARPVVGLLDLGSTTIEGLVNGTKKSGGEARHRYPRAVYDMEGTIKEFSALDAAVLYGFFRKHKGRYRLLCVVESMSDTAEHLLVLFVEKLYVFRNGKLETKVPTQLIQCAYDSTNSITLIIGQHAAKELVLPVPQPQDRALLLRKVNKLLALL